MDSYGKVTTKVTPQSQKAAKKQIKNAAGGYTFKASDEARLHRFLTLGSEGGTYYTSSDELTKENAKLVVKYAEKNGTYLVDQIVEVSLAGRAPKQNAGIFALAIAASHGDEDTRRYALSKVAAVCRTGTTMFLFNKYVEQFRGRGRALNTAVANWYQDKPVDKLTYQVLKYRQREGWTHRDVLRKVRPTPLDAGHDNLYGFVTGKSFDASDNPLLSDYTEANLPGADVVSILGRGNGLSWEMLPDEAVSDPKVWVALLEQGVPLGALLRQLPRLTRLGILTGETRKLVVSQLTDAERVVKARIHPVNVLIAAKTYSAGHGRGGRDWTPEGKVIDALNDMFYLAYGAVQPAGKRTLIAMDCSGSMSQPAGGTPISCFEAEVALGMVIAGTEPDHEIVGFSSGGRGSGRFGMGSGIQKLPITARQRLDDAVREAHRFNWGGTDCALPMIWAKKGKVLIDTFIITTDNETWAGSVHPHQALEDYRQASGVDAKLVVCAFTASRNTIADPDDPRELDVSGFDSSVPNLINDFSRGDL